MQYLDLTLPTPAENVALDDALLEDAETTERPQETLRLWEPARPMVVVGRSSRVAVEVHRDRCPRRGASLIRRPSGGAAIVTGHGCLMYALVLSRRLRAELSTVAGAHRYVLGRMAEALGGALDGICCQGTSDLAWGDRKFSGNSLRIKRNYLLYHGTLLYDFRLELIEELLAMPPRQPAYRQSRRHDAFVVNLPLPVGVIRRCLVDHWDARGPRRAWPEARVAELVAERYGRLEWNEGR